MIILPLGYQILPIDDISIVPTGTKWWSEKEGRWKTTIYEGNAASLIEGFIKINKVCYICPRLKLKSVEILESGEIIQHD